MITFLIALGALLIGYFVYSRVIERVFGADDRVTPAIAINDGVDCVPMPRWKALLIQLLNIAGTGPIFGALMGAVFGPIVYLWIVIGSVLGGAVQDYLSGMISIRNNGASFSEIVGKYLGKQALMIMRIFLVFLLILVVATFTTSPAVLIASLTPEWLNKNIWMVVIVLYYLLAAVLPIDKVIGKIYPVFGVILIVMAVGIFGGLVFGGYTLPEMTLDNLHPDGLPVFPYMCITVACGAISGFHATQSPMMAKCIKTEKTGRSVFYGAMILESVIALVWASAGVAFYKTTGGLQEALASLGQSGVVYEISVSLLGIVGGAIAIIGVVVCPISTGDTALRSARLTLAEWFNIDQKKTSKRLLVTVPLLLVSVIITQLNFDVIWRYFSWANQTLAVIVLWTIAVFLVKFGKKLFSLMAALPATFMTAVSVTYILIADEGLGLNDALAYVLGVGVAVVLLGIFVVYMIKHMNDKMSE